MTLGDFLIVFYVALVIAFVAWQWSRAVTPGRLESPEEPAEPKKPGEEPVRRAA